MLRTGFARARWAVGVAVALTLGSMLSYPGGTALDRSTEGYSLARNFLSDLGMTVAYDGRANGVGALLFVLSLSVLIAGLGGCLVGFVRLQSQSRRGRRWARAAGLVGLVAGVAFVGVAATPENRVMSLHVSFTLLGWRILPGASLLLGVASALSQLFPRRVVVAWGALTAMLLAYALLLGFGPAVGTPQGLVVQVIAQKLITAVVVASLVYLSIEADRVLIGRVTPTAIRL